MRRNIGSITEPHIVSFPYHKELLKKIGTSLVGMFLGMVLISPSSSFSIQPHSDPYAAQRLHVASLPRIPSPALGRGAFVHGMQKIRSVCNPS